MRNETDAKRSKLIQHTGFKAYDICLNTYVGCEFGCSYCYVRFFVKDKNHAWGEFVRIRKYLTEKLPKELPPEAGKRLVIGTMTDPYQPAERQHRITRSALEIIKSSDLSKVGIFTRSPIVLDDIKLIQQLPKRRVHFTVSPYPDKFLKILEPIPVSINRRFEVIKELKDAGIRVHVNIAPAIPIISDPLVEEYATRLAEIGVDEFFVDPMQAYSDSYRSLGVELSKEPEWIEVNRIMSDEELFNEWKTEYYCRWLDIWSKIGNKNTLAIWSDHENKVWVEMITGESLDVKLYDKNH